MLLWFIFMIPIFLLKLLFNIGFITLLCICMLCIAMCVFMFYTAYIMLVNKNTVRILPKTYYYCVVRCVYARDFIHKYKRKFCNFTGSRDHKKSKETTYTCRYSSGPLIPNSATATDWNIGIASAHQNICKCRLPPLFLYFLFLWPLLPVKLQFVLSLFVYIFLKT